MIFRGLSTRPGRTRAQLPHPWRAVGSTVGSAVGRRVGNPVGHGGERGGARRGARWGTVGSAVGRIVERAMRPARCGWGFCTIRRIATACRRRVASLLTQFPPRGVEESGKPREARWGAPWERERETPWSPVPNTREARQGGQIMPSRTAKRGRAHAHPRPGSQSGQSSFFRSSQRRS